MADEAADISKDYFQTLLDSHSSKMTALNNVQSFGRNCIDFTTFGGEYASLPELTDFDNVKFDATNPVTELKEGKRESAG